MTVSALVIVLGIAAVLLFSKRAGNAELFEIPGGISKELTQGNWAVYTEVVGGGQRAPREDAYTVNGPGEVDVIVYGFYADISEITLDGTTYELAAKLIVPADGTYEIEVARQEFDPEGTEPAVLGRYTDSTSWVFFMILLGTLFFLIGLVGLVVLLVGLVLRRRGRRTPESDATAT